MVEKHADYQDVKSAKVKVPFKGDYTKRELSQLNESLLEQIVALIAATVPEVFSLKWINDRRQHTPTGELLNKFISASIRETGQT